MSTMKYVVYLEGKYYVSQCLNVDVSSFGETVELAVQNLKEAVELYFENHAKNDFLKINEVTVGESLIYA